MENYPKDSTCLTELNTRTDDNTHSLSYITQSKVEKFNTSQVSVNTVHSPTASMSQSGQILKRDKVIYDKSSIYRDGGVLDSEQGAAQECAIQKTELKGKGGTYVKANTTTGKLKTVDSNVNNTGENINVRIENFSDHHTRNRREENCENDSNPCDRQNMYNKSMGFIPIDASVD